LRSIGENMTYSKLYSNGSRTPKAKMWTKALKRARIDKKARWS